MLRSGKLKLIPQRGRYVPPGPEAAKTAPTNPDRVAYFPGCSLHGTACEFDASTRAVAEVLGLELAEPRNWVCCGTGAAHSKSHRLGVVQAMKSLAMIEGSGEERVTVPCAACYSRFKAALHDFRQDPGLRQSVDEELKYQYQDRVQVSHILDTFAEQVGEERIQAAVKKPLAGLKVVTYYGCLYSRPSQVTGVRHPENPMPMDKVLAALGAEVRPWSYKTECCGASLMLTQTEVALGLSQKILDKAKEVGADAVAVACSICQMNLDGRQPQIARQAGRSYDLPVLYFTQLMGLAFGLEAERLYLGKHFVDPRPLLARQGLI
jgi:heterodisulfide reductase subunit B